MDEGDDGAEFTSRALARLPLPAPPPGLAGRALAAFDAGRHSLWARLGEMIWPGMPLWAPATAFAGALAAGVALGVLLPMAGDEGVMRFSLDQPASFSLLPPEDL